MSKHSRYWSVQLTENTLDTALKAIEYFSQMANLSKIERRRTTIALQALWGIRQSNADYPPDEYDRPVLFDQKQEVDWKDIIKDMLAQERPNIVAMRLGITDSALDYLRSGMFVPSVQMQKRMLDLWKVRHGQN